MQTPASFECVVTLHGLRKADASRVLDQLGEMPVAISDIDLSERNHCRFRARRNVLLGNVAGDVQRILRIACERAGARPAVSLSEQKRRVVMPRAQWDKLVPAQREEWKKHFYAG